MGKIFAKASFLLLLFLFFGQVIFAQTITIGAVDPGPYGQGSTIAVPITVSGCINSPSNVYNLYLSDANGNFGSPTLIGTTNGFYAQFVNGVIPANVSTGSNYKVRVQSTQTSTPGISTAFTINASAGIKAGTSSTAMNAAVNAEVFGSCSGVPQNFSFANTSQDGNPATAHFFNELDGADEGTFPLNTVFSAKSANYTVTVKTVRNGLVGTKAYQLINNVTNNSFTITGNGTVCMGSGNVLEYNVDITTSNGLQKNYPGLTYNISWGDGVISKYTFCDIVAANGKVSHAYTNSSCSQVNHRFQINIQPISTYCNSLTQPVTTYAKVVAPPQNRFSFPENVCTNAPVTFINQSDPGDDPNSTSASCENLNARYTWYVDGVLQPGVYQRLDPPFRHTFLTHGKHQITLHLENTSGLCDAPDVTHEICVQDPPKPDFDIPQKRCLSDGPLTAINNSVVDEICNTNTIYNWVRVAGPANGVSFNASAKAPVFNFSQIGVYQFRLDITTPSCGTVQGPTKTIVVNSTPAATLSANTTICSVNTAISFDPTAVETKTSLVGTAQPEANTYTWTLNNGATFAPGSDSHTQYPKIIFPAVGVYTVSVSHQNNCGGPVIASQQITLANGPSVTADATPTTICEGDMANLTGSPGVGGIVTAVHWTSATGGSFSNANSPLTMYTPSAADINAGQVTLIYTVTTSLGGACSTVPKSVTVQIVKKAVVNSTNTGTVCSGNNFNYTITSATATTYNWTAALTSGSATGFGATGSGNTINDVITNTGVTNATVTYTITPYVNACPGNPFTLTLTVTPQAVGGTANADQNIVCANGNSGIVTLTGSVGSIIWQRSVNGGSTWTDIVPAQTSTIYAFSGLAQTTKFRAKLNTGSCGDVFSTDATVTVNPPTPLADAGVDPAPLCNLTQYTLQGNNSGTFVGVWTQESGPAATIVNPADPHSNVTGLIPGNAYTFRWTIKGLPPCADTFDDVVIVVKPDVVAKFEPSTTQVCGFGPLQFNNTSNVTAGVNFLWDFGDGTPTSTEINPTHSFAPNPDGTDAHYTVTLKVIGNCVERPAFPVQITVGPASPIAGMSKDQGSGGCGVLTLTDKNLSPGTNATYEFHLEDENGNTIETILKNGNDKSNAVFQPHPVDHQATWHTYLKVTDNCGNTSESAHFEVPVSPGGLNSAMQIQGSPASVCVGNAVTFINTSTGGTNFTYTIYNAAGTAVTTIPVANNGNITYSFANAGSYYITVKASNAACGTAPESEKIGINVYSQPKPSFTFTVDSDNKVTFVNTTPNVDGISSSSFQYTWDFGDGLPDESAFTPFDHVYDYVNSPYTVTLTAVTPGGCRQSTTRKIEIKFLGELFLPNAFQPASSTSELRTFMAKGQKLKEWNLQIFNNWGQLLWQTTKLDSNGSPTEGWDGTFKGQPVPQGTYIWQATAKFINGAEWKGNVLKGSLPKRTGVIHLIR